MAQEQKKRESALTTIVSMKTREIEIVEEKARDCIRAFLF
jgi:hypothetical protein